MEANNPEARRTSKHSIPRYTFVDGAYQARTETAFIDSDTPPMGARSPIEDPGVPKDYLMFTRKALLLDGQKIDIAYGIHKSIAPQFRALNKRCASVIAGFIYTLEATTNSINKPLDVDDRAEYISTVFGYALYEGLTDEEVLVCYNTAYLACKNVN